MKAMILAAGLGTRLLPHTLKRPKPLFPILDKPLLHLTIKRLQEAGFSEIVVNAHHLREQIKQALQDIPDVQLQEEEAILGTGGGLRRALDHFGQDPVLVVNGDIYHSIDYREVYRFHCNTRPDVTLVLHDYPRFNDVGVNSLGRVSGFKKTKEKNNKAESQLAFTGIHIINPDILQAIPPDVSCCIIDCYEKLLEQGGEINAFVAKDHFWTDMGTQADYLKLHGDLLAGKVPVYEELDDAVANGPYAVMPNAVIDKDVQLLDWVSIGQGARIGPGSTLQRAVVWDGAIVAAGSSLKDAIVTG